MTTTTDPIEFGRNIRAFAEAKKRDISIVVREVAIEILTRIVMRSPVGNPELWAANAHAVGVNNAVARYNAKLRSSPGNLNTRGRLKPGLKMKALQGKELRGQLSLAAGKGYVGGRFRGAWTVSIGAPAQSPKDRTDPSGALAKQAGVQALDGFEAGPTIYITNTLPYAHRLEYEGWSKQAPAGFVRVTVTEVNEIMRAAVAKARTQ